MKIILLHLIIFGTISYGDFSKQNGVVIDDINHLAWQDDYSENEDSIKIATWKTAIDYCENLELDGRGWRLPNIKELLSLVDDTRYTPAINPIFEFTNYDRYWTSTSLSGYNNYAWTVHFNEGFLRYYRKDTTNSFVRCVREE